jgi:hypothetical protein
VKLLDTSVAIDYLKGRTEAVDLLEELLERNETLTASEVVRLELLAGARPGEFEPLESFCSALNWIPVDEAVTREAAGFARAYRRSNIGIDGADYLIAATKVLSGADLLTINVRHFPMFGGLKPPY